MEKTNNLPHTYYFAVGNYDNDYDDLWDDDENCGIAMTYSAEFIYILQTRNPISYDDFNNIVSNCKNIIKNKQSSIFDYPDNFSKENVDEFIDYDDIIFEMEEQYGVNVSKSYYPIIWGNDVWESDLNYSYENPPDLWRLLIYDYE